MDQVYVFLIRNDVWIYFLCGLGIVWYLLEYMRSRRGLRRSAFSLERESNMRTRNSSLLLLLFFTSVVGVVTYTNYAIRPNLPPELLRPPTPTPDPFSAVNTTPTPPVERLRFPTATPIIAPTATLRSLTGGDQPSAGSDTADSDAAIDAIRVGCTDTVNISQPVSGGVISGGISVFGSATAPNFGFYDLEVNGPQTRSQWVSLLANTFNQPITNGFLGGSNLQGWALGVYQLRLTVVDSDDATLGQCVIQFGLEN